jgi:hypothetical protein
MSTAITVLLLVGLIVFLSMITPSGSSFLDHAPVDRDRERQLAELRAHADAHPSRWNAASRADSASSSARVPAASAWKGSHRISPSR